MRGVDVLSTTDSVPAITVLFLAVISSFDLILNRQDSGPYPD